MKPRNSTDATGLLDALTPKQRSTLELVAEGRTLKEIAFDQWISQAAAVKRVESLREKFACSTKNQLSRKSRELLEKEASTYKNPIGQFSSTGQKFHLVETSADIQDGVRHRDEAMLEFSDVLHTRSELPWSSFNEPSVVPEALDRAGSGVWRIAMAVGIALALGILAMVIAGVANAVADLL